MQIYQIWKYFTVSADCRDNFVYLEIYTYQLAFSYNSYVLGNYTQPSVHMGNAWVLIS